MLFRVRREFYVIGVSSVLDRSINRAVVRDIITRGSVTRACISSHAYQLAKFAARPRPHYTQHY